MLTPENLAAGAVLAGLILYAIFAGADFGGGIWTALAFGPRAKEQRQSLGNAIGPVWETHNVWLIFVVVTLFTAFPVGFSALFIALLAPFVIALVGINFRGAAFAFRHFGEHSRTRLPATEQVFSITSILTPLTMGMAVTTVAAGRIQIVNGQVNAGLWSSWITPFTIVGGLAGLAMCAYLAPVFMTVRTTGDLQEDFRKAGIAAAITLGVLTALEIPVAWLDAPQFIPRLFAPVTLAIILLAVLAGIISLGTLWTRHYQLAQLIAAGTVALTFLGFGAAMYPDLILGQLTIQQAAAPRATLIAYLEILPIGAVILIPSLLLLYWTFRGEPNPEIPAESTEAK